MSRSTPPGIHEVVPNDSLGVDSGWSTVPPAPARIAGPELSSGPAAESPLDRAPSPFGPAVTRVEQSGVKRLPTKGRAHGTLLGVAPPQPAEPTVPSLRIPVVVHSGVTKPEALPIPLAPPAQRAADPIPPQPVHPEADAGFVIPVLDSDEEPTIDESASTAFKPLVAPAAVVARATAPSLGELMASQVRFAGGERRLWGVLASLACVLVIATASAAMFGGWRIGMATKASAPTQARVVSSPEAAPQATAPQAGRDAEAPEAKSPDEQSANHVLAQASLASDKKRQAAKLLRERLGRDPAAIKDKAVLVELRKVIADPRTAHEALAAVAGLPGPVSADLLYEVWTATPNRTETTDLARALVHSRDVRAKASEALAVALDLRLAEACDATGALLPRALQVGDRRSLHLLMKLKKKQGCGPKKSQDCYACLREGGELDAAINAVQARRASNPLAGP